MAKADLKRRGLYLPTTKRKWRTGVGFVAMARVTDIRRSKVA